MSLSWRAHLACFPNHNHSRLLPAGVVAIATCRVIASRRCAHYIFQQHRNNSTTVFVVHRCRRRLGALASTSFGIDAPPPLHPGLLRKQPPVRSKCTPALASVYLFRLSRVRRRRARLA